MIISAKSTINGQLRRYHFTCGIGAIADTARNLVIIGYACQTCPCMFVFYAYELMLLRKQF